LHSGHVGGGPVNHGHSGHIGGGPVGHSHSGHVGGGPVSHGHSGHVSSGPVSHGHSGNVAVGHSSYYSGGAGGHSGQAGFAENLIGGFLSKGNFKLLVSSRIDSLLYLGRKAKTLLVPTFRYI
jgi:hypothetical protein